ncbi:helix-turn-helix domain-containing protein, partial [Candidatus Microgenomates bacterium]|nr:helix-turn-helix domain-containing protein [Candidatus Microgenomates bacterium]
MSQIGEEKLWTVEDMAEFCQVKPSVVRYWLRNTDIPFIRLGKQIRFEPEKMKEWVKE